MTMNRLNSKLLLCAAALAATSVAGCADGHSEVEGSETDALGLQAPATPATAPNDNEFYFKNIKANGTGCKPGSWEKSISTDGLAFTLTFSEYDISISPTETRISKNCLISLDVHSPQGISVGISNFYYGGYAYLEEGVTMEQQALYYYSGTRADPTRPSYSKLPRGTDTTWDAFWNIEDKVKLEDIVWSKCGVDRLLNVNTQLTLKNGANGKKGTGQTTTQAVDGNISLVLKLATKSCGDAGPGLVVPDAGPIRK